MSQEAAPERAVPEQSAPQSVPAQKDAGAPKGLLQQMEELMAALSADLSQLDADIQSSADRLESEPTQPGTHAEHSGTEHREDAGDEPDSRPAPGDARPLF
ncbi:hypothetical protein [Streptomyces exfoliatus]|uniref:hypothetical protein n=1 Tax=Streptomyces exfoliatus TaxID=1905 RepID=UPI0004642615|nr:hypothetical protein [Streptomyces exfoliatus]